MYPPVFTQCILKSQGASKLRSSVRKQTYVVMRAGFKTAWRACTNDTAVRHLDVDAPLVSRGLYEQARDLNSSLIHAMPARVTLTLTLAVHRSCLASGR